MPVPLFDMGYKLEKDAYQLKLTSEELHWVLGTLEQFEAVRVFLMEKTKG